MCPKLLYSTFRSAFRSPGRPASRPTTRLGRQGRVAGALRLIGGVGVLLALAAPLRAEVVTLVDNTQVAGKLTHYYDGLLVLETPNGQKLELPREKVKQITFKLPPPRAEFSTPEKVFDRWRQAMQKGESQKSIECYALMYQGMMQQQMLQTPDAMKQAQKDMEGVKFDTKGTTFKTQGETKLATLKVLRTKGDNVQTDEVRFVQENGEWKMTP